MTHRRRNPHRLAFARSEGIGLILLLLAILAVGLVIAPDYGQGTDEYSDFTYAANNLRAYAGASDFTGPSFEELHGPFHMELAYLVGEAAFRLPLGWTRTDGRHLANFGAFLICLTALYFLLRRNLRPLSSLLTTALFASQPYLWGHAFINEKDTAFMAYFALAMALGLTASDRLDWPSTVGRMASESAGGRGQEEGTARKILSWSLVGCTVILAIAALGNLLFLPAAQAVLGQAYNGSAWQPVQTAFRLIATDAYKTPIGEYMDKLGLVYAWAKIPLALVWLSAGWWIMRRRLPGIWSRLVAPLPLGLTLLLTSGVALGLADSIRVAAPLAGALVGGYLLIRHGRKGWVPLAIYGLTALGVTYLTWPWLWSSPVSSYLEAVRVMSAFPSHRVLFGGVVYSSADLPWDYVPRLLAIETTEVVVPLFVVGLGLMLRKSFRSAEAGVDLAINLLWLGAPIALAVGLHSSLYGNLRQMLFIFPPLFIVAGHAVQAILSRLSLRIYRVLFALVVLIPGILGITWLHPYESSYFNAWVGGTSGAFERYQVDPWCTSYRQAMDYINAHAPPDAIVDVRGPFQSAKDFARGDLRMHPDYNPAPDPDFELLCQIDLLGEGFQAPLPVVYRVTRGRAILATVRAKP